MRALEVAMSNIAAALICASALWAIFAVAALYEFPKRAPGEAWVVTASDEIATRPALVRANVARRDVLTTASIR
jgi:hypothetical protein